MRFRVTGYHCYRLHAHARLHDAPTFCSGAFTMDLPFAFVHTLRTCGRTTIHTPPSTYVCYTHLVPTHSPSSHTTHTTHTRHATHPHPQPPDTATTPHCPTRFPAHMPHPPPHCTGTFPRFAPHHTRDTHTRLRGAPTTTFATPTLLLQCPGSHLVGLDCYIPCRRQLCLLAYLTLAHSPDTRLVDGSAGQYTTHQPVSPPQVPHPLPGV